MMSDTELTADAMAQYEGQELRTENGYTLGVLEAANLRGERHKFRLPGGDTVSRRHTNVATQIRSRDGLAFRDPAGDY